MRSHRIQRLVMNQQPLEPLVRKARKLDLHAWQALWLAIDPRIESSPAAGG